MSDLPTRLMLETDVDALYAEIERLRATNAELVAALKPLMAAISSGRPPTQLAEDMRRLRAAIAKAGGKE